MGIGDGLLDTEGMGLMGDMGGTSIWIGFAALGWHSAPTLGMCTNAVVSTLVFVHVGPAHPGDVRPGCDCRTVGECESDIQLPDVEGVWASTATYFTPPCAVGVVARKSPNRAPLLGDRGGMLVCSRRGPDPVGFLPGTQLEKTV